MQQKQLVLIKSLRCDNMPLNTKGKKMLNILVAQYGARKGRDIFYAMETKHPDWVRRWRE